MPGLNLVTTLGERAPRQPLSSRGRGGWGLRAECFKRGVDPELFFPRPGEPISEAVFSACSACQVRAQCLRYVMQREPDEFGRRHGIWAGLTPKQRTYIAAGKSVKLLVPTSYRNRQRGKAATV